VLVLASADFGKGAIPKDVPYSRLNGRALRCPLMKQWFKFTQRRKRYNRAFQLSHGISLLSISISSCLGRLASSQTSAASILKSMDTVGTRYSPTPGMSMEQAMMDQPFGDHLTSTYRIVSTDHPEYCVNRSYKINAARVPRVVDASCLPVHI
jgi:hypothetical protein